MKICLFDLNRNFGRENVTVKTIYGLNLKYPQMNISLFWFTISVQKKHGLLIESYASDRLRYYTSKELYSGVLNG